MTEIELFTDWHEGCSYASNPSFASEVTIEKLEEAARLGGEITAKYHEDVARSLFGITLIPDDSLRDNEYKVSRAVFEAARRIGK